MPQIRVAVWNIQNFGGANQDNKRGGNGQLMAYFIRDFARGMMLDVIMIQEVTQNALPVLQTVVATMNAGLAVGDADWRYDWIKGSAETGRPFPPQTSADTSWDSGGARYEGYAILWRSNRAAFRLVPALRNASEGTAPPPAAADHFLELVTSGLGFHYTDQNHWWVTTGYNPAQSATQPFTNTLAPTPWAQLDFPKVTNLMFPAPHQTRSRRPALAIMEMNNGSPNVQDRLCPLIFYHSPSEQVRAEIGTFLSALSQHLNVTNGLNALNQQDPLVLVRANNAIAGGDYNRAIRDPADIGFIYEKFTDPYSNVVLDGGSAMQFVNLVGQPTTVQINSPALGRFGGPPITSANNIDYRWLSIDQLFYRTHPAIGALSGIYDMLAELRRDRNLFRQTLQMYRQHLQLLIWASGMAPNAATGPRTAAGPIFGNFAFNNWDAFWDDLEAAGHEDYPYFTTARSAAEFYHIFISDHLPIVLAFQW